LLCGQKEIANISCPNGHFICDECHGKDVFNIVKDYVQTAISKDPLEMAEFLMANKEKVPMLGCENAWIAAGAFMAALKNEGTIKITNDQVFEVLNRTKKQAVGGYCGLTGVCGIVPAMGACFSTILGAACPKDQETATTMRVAGRIVNVIANETGPCCCKNFVRTALTEASKLAEEILHVTLPLNHENIICNHTERHPHGCRIEKCNFYKEGETPVISGTDKERNMEVSISCQYDEIIKMALDLGVERAKIIDTESVVVGDWVRWKCQYGCPLYNKDASHPPLAPTTEEMRNVLKEYNRALFINGFDGPQLSSLAVQIEHELYHRGYYKSFALIALPFSKGAT